MPATSVALPITIAQATCTTLTLRAGVTDHRLLGWRVHLNPTDLILTARSESGQPPGNLFCALADLRNRPNLPAGLATRLLNELLSQYLG